MLRKLVERVTKPVAEKDREKLVELCDTLGCDHCDELSPRSPVRVVGEVSSVRVVPRAGAPSLEVTVSDGRGHVTGVFFGRRRLAGLAPGRRILLEGVVAPRGGRNYLYNPVYQLL